MIKNEENFIGAILRELVAVFPRVVVYDTDSTDNTLAIIKTFSNVELIERPMDDLYEIGELKTEIFERAGYPVLKVDGDEYYPREVLQYLVEMEDPKDKAMGFTLLRTVGVRENGKLYIRGEKNTDAIFLEKTVWNNHYPFEANSLWNFKDKYFYIGDTIEKVGCSGLHIHHLKRSSKDNETPFRMDKKDWYKPQEDRGDVEISDLIFPDDILRKYNPYYGGGK